MVDHSLSASEIANLSPAHRGTCGKHQADRTEAVILRASGRTAGDIGAVLLIDPHTACNHFKRYCEGELVGLLHPTYRNSAPERTEAQLAVFDARLQSESYLSAKDIAAPDYQ